MASISSGEPGRLSARPSQSFGDRLGAMLPQRERRGGEARSSPRRLTEPRGPSGSEPRGPSGGEACQSFQATGAGRSSGGKWPGAGRRGKLTEPKGLAAKKVGQGEAIGQLLGLWLHDLCLVTGHLALPGVPRNALLCS